MNKTELKPKVINVGRGDGVGLPAHGSTNSPHGPKEARKSTRSPRDTYSASGVDPYKQLISGKMKAIDTPIGEMLGVMDRQTVKRRRDPYQTLIGNLMMGDAEDNSPSPADFELPYVPDLEREIFRLDPQRQYDMKPLVERYEQQAKMITRLLTEVDKRLEPSEMYRIRDKEIESLQDHRKDLVNLLSRCRKELGKAKFYYDWELQDKAKAELEEAKKKKTNGA